MRESLFRKLKANEIEVRVGTAKNESKGISLLLYIDARAAMEILDESLGPYNWKREHFDLGGRLYCALSIYNKENNEWIPKCDVGTESNTEKEKGQASDAFKRACVNAGIGRELYTAPLIWVTPDKGGKFDKYKVNKIEYNDDGEIKDLEIYNISKKIVAFKMGQSFSNNTQGYNNSKKTGKSEAQLNRLNVIAKNAGNTLEDVKIYAKKHFGINDLMLLNKANYEEICSKLEAKAKTK